MGFESVVGRPWAGVEYPRDGREFERWFVDEVSCAAYLERLRWPEGFVCARCGGRRCWLISTRPERRRCASCRFEVSLRSGTLLADSRVPLGVWLRAVWLVSSQKRGVSALDLQRLLGLGSYETAWTMLHKLRRAMRPTSGLLYGLVEIDETYIGGPSAQAQGRRQANKAIVAIAVEKHEPKGLGRARLERIMDVSADTLTGFVQRNVAASFPDAHERLCETILETDGWHGYDRLAAAGYRHERISLNQTRDRKAAHRELPACHRVAALLKRWLLGTHQGGVNHEQLDAYLDEFVFRFNRRSSRSIGLRFHRLLTSALQTPPSPYKTLIAASTARPHS